MSEAPRGKSVVTPASNIFRLMVAILRHPSRRQRSLKVEEYGEDATLGAKSSRERADLSPLEPVSVRLIQNYAS